MNYYPFHIGDYASATRHLSWDEDMAYRRLLDAYYMREEPLPGDVKAIYRLVAAASKAQRAAVDAVLAEFFTKSERGFENARCDEELANVQTKRNKAKASADKRWGNANHERTDCEGNANAYANAERTDCEGNAPNNQEPITNIALASDKRAREPMADIREGDPPHWSVSQAILADHQQSLDDWELEFVHSIKWNTSLTKAQAEKLKAIQDKVSVATKPPAPLPSVKRGSPQYDAWIAHYRRTKGKAKFYETLDVLTVPTEYPPSENAAQ